ncbi:MAG: DNA mismatch repair protein MutS [Hyphomonadaceae bacterium]|nr:DNA mismatch repair protein MutS [Clostridia bacterium]
MALTPMLQQYLLVKEQYEDCILFFRLGDFYEMFFTDAEIASKELELTLTGRGEGENRAPMCGIPYHAADNYINRLVQKGFKVAICEQTETPAEAKGIVKREVVRVVTPGTVTDSTMLEEGKNNYLACVVLFEKGYGLSFVDVSTGELFATQFPAEGGGQKLVNEFARFTPSEIICNSAFLAQAVWVQMLLERFGVQSEAFDDRAFEYDSATSHLTFHFGVPSLSGTPLYGHELAIQAVAGLLKYLELTQKISLGHINTVQYYTDVQFMDMDAATRRSLELTETMREKGKKNSLLWVLDKTKTAMGARLLRKWMEQPLLQAAPILRRLSAVEELHKEPLLRLDLLTPLKNIYDIERLMSKITYGTVNGKDLIALKKSIGHFPEIKSLLFSTTAPMLQELHEKLDPLTDLFDMIESTIIEDAPFTVREGGIIQAGVDPEVDRLRTAKTEGKQWLAKLESDERQITGIKTLKVGYNRVFGYYIEISKGQTQNAPDRYTRKQTLSNCERYITPELKEIEDTVLGAEEKLVQLEYTLFCQIRDKIALQMRRIQDSAKNIATVDVLTSFAEVASKDNYAKPHVDMSDKLNITDGRHPVVEQMLTTSLFVPNDTTLDGGDNRLSIITGPNMAGKSTYMRQVALIVLMAQIGSFVPAKAAHIGIVDRIFTRVGASDDLASGQSTFMVEMIEVANILNNATRSSLLILDEMGRGTSTYDGLSMAWAVIEYIADIKKMGAKTLFATHYHELTELEDKLNGVKNYCVAVKKRGDDITFLRKIMRGGADDSYGIEVAKLAGVPEVVIKRAKQILQSLEQADINKTSYVQPLSTQSGRLVLEETGQTDLFDMGAKTIIEQLKQLELSTLTPIEALNLLYQLQQKAKETIS